MTSSADDPAPRPWRPGRTESPERELYLLLQHASGELIRELAALLKPVGLTPEQYHVLRVLGDAGAPGIACGAIAERSPSGDPDVTRLLDRLERQGLASRVRGAVDRRVVMARITADGRRVLRDIEQPVQALHERQFGALSERGRQDLRRLLGALTTPAAE